MISKNCNLKRLCLATLAAFVFIFLYEWVFHSKIMMGFYKETAHLWRPEHEMGKYFWWMVLMQIGLAKVLGIIFVKGYENKGVMEGVRFGLYAGGLLAIPNLATWGYMPISITLALAWGAGVLVEAIGVGVVLSLVYKE